MKTVKRVTCISDTELAKLATAEYDKYKKGMATFSAILIGITALAIAIPLYKYYGFVKSCPLPVLSLLPQGGIADLFIYFYNRWSSVYNSCQQQL